MNKIFRHLILFFLLGTPLILFAQSKSEYVQIVNKFEQWKKDQYKKGNYATEKNCDRDTVLKAGYKGAEIGIPTDIHISFTNINDDSKLDAIITFNPTQCDGGNALMNAQIRVLILTNVDGDTTDDSYIDEIESQFKKGWLIIDGALYGSFYGAYYEYKDSDGRCCPSIKKPFSIDYKTKKLTFDK